MSRSFLDSGLGVQLVGFGASRGLRGHGPKDAFSNPFKSLLSEELEQNVTRILTPCIARKKQI